jgi:hypothetical protein
MCGALSITLSDSDLEPVMLDSPPLRCPFHVSTEMVPVSMERPKFAPVPRDGEATYSNGKRRVWVCPIVGCRYVSDERPRSGIARPRRRCRECGAKVDHNRSGYTSRCRKCLNADARDRARRRRARDKCRREATKEVPDVNLLIGAGDRFSLSERR